MQQPGARCTGFVPHPQQGSVQRAASWRSPALTVLLFTPSVLGCGDTIEIGDESFSGVDPIIVDGGVIPSFDPTTRPPLNFSCEDASLPTEPCGAAFVPACSDAGNNLLTRIDLLDCDLARGLTGDKGVSRSNCDEAFAGQSGDGCAASFVCVRRSVSVPCCLEVAACERRSATLLRTRACAQVCPLSAMSMSPFIESCSDLAAAVAGIPQAHLALGLPCNGSFICDEDLVDVSKSAAMWSPKQRFFYCPVGNLQSLDTYSTFSQAGDPPPDAGYP